MPQFQVDPFWPKPLPNNWILGQVSGIATDKYDRIWVVHRPGSLTPRERAAEQNPPEAKCCIAAPPVLVFDQSGNLLRPGAGPAPGYQWPESEHGIYVDENDFVWLAGNGKNDGQLLKFTMDGKFVLQIGKQGERQRQQLDRAARLAGRRRGRRRGEGSVRRRRLRQPPRGGVRLRDRRVQAPLGRLRQQAERREDAALRSGAAAFAAVRQPGALHPALASDGLVYVCDRTNDRMQVFRKDGSFVSEHVFEKETRGTGSVYDLVFSPDRSSDSST